MKKGTWSVFLLLNLVFLQTAYGEQLRAYVAEFKILGVSQPAEMKGLLPDLLSSRLNGGAISVVDTIDEADLVVTGRYTQSGNLFSIDAVASNKAGKVVARDYVEGQSQDQLLPAVGNLAGKLAARITAAPGSAGKIEPAPMPSAKPAAGTPIRSGNVVIEQAGAAAEGASWTSQRLADSFSGMAPGRRLENGDREIFLFQGHELKLFRQGKDLVQIAEVSFKVDEQILGVDTADLDGDGNPEVYVTLFNGDALVSQVWQVRGSSLEKVAEKLPYYFRSIALEGKGEKLYAQEMALRSDYFGAVREVAKNGNRYFLKEPVKLPQGATLYNFNRFRDGNGNVLFVTLNEEGILAVHAENGEELWRSKDKYGGTELFFKRADLTDVKYGSDPYRWIYLQQRIFVTNDGEVVVSQNSGSWNAGLSRSYSKSCLDGFRWNGSSLEKKWHTRENENYLADYFYDASGQELVSLEVVKHAGMFNKGASVVSVRKIR